MPLRYDFDRHEMDIRVSMDTIWTSKTAFWVLSLSIKEKLKMYYFQWFPRL